MCLGTERFTVSYKIDNTFSLNNHDTTKLGTCDECRVKFSLRFLHGVLSLRVQTKSQKKLKMFRKNARILRKL